MNAAMWSALAASFSATAAIVMMLIHRRNLLESVRPVIMLEEWERRQGTLGNIASEQIVFKSVRNVGKGPALHVYMNAMAIGDDGKPQGMMSTFRSAIIPPNDRVQAENAITVFFQNATGQEAERRLPVDIQIGCRDSRGRIHLTVYRLLIFENVNQVAGSHIAAGVILTTWGTHSETVFRRRVRRQLRRVSSLGRLAKADY